MLLGPSVKNQKAQDEWNILRDEQLRLEALVRKDDELYSAAWAEYGSELAGPPSSLKANQLKVKEIEIQMALLQDFMDGKINLNEESELDRQMVDSESRMFDCKRQLDRIKKVKELIK